MTFGRAPIDVDEDAFVADWAAGLTLVELATKYGASTSTVSVWSVRFCCPSRTPGRRPGSGVTHSSPAVLTDGEWAVDDRGIMRWVAVG